LKLDRPTIEGHELALIDCGLMASVDPVDRDNMISTLIHLANKDYSSLVDDFVKLKILPEDSNRAAIIPLMDKALSPYVKGGGAKKYEAELRKMYGMEDNSMSSQVGGFQAMTQDALTVLNDIPFSIPPYFAILGRAIITLEGVALSGNPDYGIIMESYPFIARKLLREDRPEIQSALQEVLFCGNEGRDLKLSRLLVLLNNAAGSIATKEGSAFVDLDTVPENGISFGDGLKYILSDKSTSLCNLLEAELEVALDIMARQFFRKGATEAIIALSPPKPPSLPFLGDIFPSSPNLDEIPLPLLLPKRLPNGQSTPFISILTLKEFTDIIAPKLSQDEDIYAIGLTEAVKEFLGEDVAEFVRGDSIFSFRSAEFVFRALRSGTFGRLEFLKNEMLQNILLSTSKLLSTSVQQSGAFEEELTAAIENLSPSEKSRLNQIIDSLLSKNIDRILDRFAKI
jgi:aarF domain-containing kinase